MQTAHSLILPALLLWALCLVDPALAGKILAWTLPGSASHYLNAARLGQELVSRGHDFSMLMSSTELSAQALLQDRHPDLTLQLYQGASEFAKLGTPEAGIDPHLERE